MAVSLTIDIGDFGAESHPDDYVILYAPVFRESAERSGGLVSTAPRRVYLTGGKAAVEVEPGPLAVEFCVRNIKDSSTREFVVPAGGGSLGSLLAASLDYEPVVVTRLQELIDSARDAAERLSGAAASSAGNAKKSESAAKAAQARSEEIATSTSWDGDKLTVNGKTSPSLRGPKGDKGDKGETGSVENVSWDDISDKPDFASTWEQVKGKPESFPPAPHTHTTAQVEGLDDALAGKADKGHRHKVEDVDGLKERLDQQDGATDSVYSSILDVRRKLNVKADESYVNSQIASTRSYVDRAVANGSKIKVVSSLPSYPDSSTVYIVV